jgi:alkylhydroperoxidase family enzyme
MSFINTISPSDASDETQAMYLWQQKDYGYVPNYAKVFSHRPEIMSLWAGLQRGIRKNINDRDFELTTLAAALELSSTNCALAHANQLGTIFTSTALKAIIRGRGLASGVISEAENTMMSYARKIARDASSTTQRDIDALKLVGYGDAQIFDITATAAARSFFTKIIEGLGAETDHSYPQMDHELRDMLVVGRPAVNCQIEICDHESNSF